MRSDCARSGANMPRTEWLGAFAGSHINVKLQLPPKQKFPSPLRHQHRLGALYLIESVIFEMASLKARVEEVLRSDAVKNALLEACFFRHHRRCDSNSS